MDKIDYKSLGHRAKSWKRKLEAINWEKVQEYHNTNNINRTIEKFNLTRTIFYKACELKLIKKIIHKQVFFKKRKQEISKQRKKFLRENPDKHPWKNSKKFISHPCEILKQALRDNNIYFEEEYTPLKSRAFSLDIAFVDKKIALEINGNQHYQSNGKLKPYYQERHDLLVEKGWTVHEIHYKNCYNKNFIKKICKDFEYLKIKDIKTYINYMYEKVLRQLVNKTNKKYYCLDCKKDVFRTSKRCMSCNARKNNKRKVVNRPSLETILNDIKETSFVATGKKYGVSDNTIRKWIKYYQNTT